MPEYSKEQEKLDDIKETIVDHLDRGYDTWSNSMMFLLNASCTKQEALLICEQIGNDNFTKKVDESYFY